MNISSLQNDYLNLDSERAHAFQTNCTFCGGVNHSAEKCFKKIRKEKEKSRAVDVLGRRRTERMPRKCFRCGSEDHILAKFPKPPKYNEKRKKQVRFNEKGNCACDNGENNSDQNIYAYMARMSNKDKCSSENYSDSLQLTNWILDSGATCHMTP